MVPDFIQFGAIIVTSIGAAILFRDCFIKDSSKFLEAYGGCDCTDCVDSGYEKIESFYRRGKRYRVVTSSKMSTKYSKIYNVTQGKWAYNISGENDAQKIYAHLDWDENDALVGFYDNGLYNVIFCRPGYAVYVQSAGDDEVMFRPPKTNIHIPAPPAFLVNLNDAFDGSFLFSKLHPISPSEEDEDEDKEEQEQRLKSGSPQSQRVIDFLYRCRDATDNKYKRAAYERAIEDVDCVGIMCTGGPSIQRKIKEFLDGVPEEDIIYS